MIEATQEIGLGCPRSLVFRLGNFERQPAGQVGLALLLAYFDLEDACHATAPLEPAHDAVRAYDPAGLDVV